MAARWQIALVVKDAGATQIGLLLTRVRSPPSSSSSSSSSSSQCSPHFSFQDSDLWDLPSAPLALTSQNKGAAAGAENENLITESAELKEVAENVARDLEGAGLPHFNCIEAVEKIQSLVIPVEVSRVTWKFCRLLEEPDFGPGDRLHTAVFIVQTHAIKTSGGDVHWFTYPNVYKLLVQAEIGEKRIGLLAAIGFSLFSDNLLSKNCVDVPGQEYPPGITILPMESRTLKPFSKTNLVVIASARPVQKDEKNEKMLTFGDSLIVDPGSSSVAAKAQLARIIKSLPEKLLVFLTHHHVDHIEGLTIVQQQNPQAIILAHESTLKRAGKAVKAFDCMAVSGGARLLVAGQELEIIAAPGHTDSHLALFHLGVRTLIAGDHCVGEGSSFLDADSGGNMQEYLCTTRQFIKLRPHFIVPMHGRPNFWPIHLLKGYIRHREARELKILKAIENGARTAYEIVSEAYKETPATAWPAALHNVKLHVEHLNQSNSLPLDFSIKAFQKSSGAAFFFNHVPTAVSEVIRSCMSYRHKAALSGISGSIVLVVAIGLSLLWAKCKHYHARA